MAFNSYVYFGFSDTNPNIVKIGYTERTCWTRCKGADYTIYGAANFDGMLSKAEILFFESYLRMCFNAMAEVKQQLKTDYFVLYPFSKFKDFNEEIAFVDKWFFTFVNEAIEILNKKRAFTYTPAIESFSKFHGRVMPYSY